MAKMLLNFTVCFAAMPLSAFFVPSYAYFAYLKCIFAYILMDLVQSANIFSEQILIFFRIEKFANHSKRLKYCTNCL